MYYSSRIYFVIIICSAYYVINVSWHLPIILSIHLVYFVYPSNSSVPPSHLYPSDSSCLSIQYIPTEEITVFCNKTYAHNHFFL